LITSDQWSKPLLSIEQDLNAFISLSTPFWGFNLIRNFFLGGKSDAVLYFGIVASGG
jgi:hypothetical protein